VNSAGAVQSEILRVQNLSIRALVAGGSIPLVENVSFSIGRNRTTCLVGESGSGKSLTARAITRLDPSLAMGSDTQIMDNGALMGLAETETRGVRGGTVAMIFQEPMGHLNPVYTVGDQVAEMLIWHTGISRRHALERVRELFRLVGIQAPDQRIHQFPYELSGGMQ
jgi:ABC-type microcin C transport system duplicated ATPase subunit YejF